MKKPAKIEELNKNMALAKNERPIPAVNKGEESLKFHEQGLRDNADSMFAFAMHLFQIKSKELWRIPGCNSYKDYCETRVITLFKIPFGKSQLYRLAEWAEVNEDVSPIGESASDASTPTVNEAQARELAKAPKKKRAKVLAEASKDGKATAKKIAEVIEKQKPVTAEFREIVKDHNGDEVPEPIAAEFQRAEKESKENVLHAQAIKNYLERDDATTVEARGLRETAKDLLAGLKTHLTKHVLCPKCGGKKCAVCSKRGFVSNYFATKGIGKKEA